MNITKLIQTVYFVLKKYNNRINYTKLIKILYLSDRESINQIGVSITDNETYNLHNGPILSELLDLIKNNYNPQIQTVWNQYYKKDGNYLVCINDAISDDELSEFEESIIDEQDSKYHERDVFDIIDNVLHNHEICPEWEDPGQFRSDYLSKEKIMDVLGYNRSEIKHIIKNNAAYNEELLKTN